MVNCDHRSGHGPSDGFLVGCVYCLRFGFLGDHSVGQIPMLKQKVMAASLNTKRKTWSELMELVPPDLRLTRREGVTLLYCPATRHSVESSGLRPIYDVLTVLRGARSLLGQERTAAAIALSRWFPPRSELCTEEIELWVPAVNERLVVCGLYNFYLVRLAYWNSATRETDEGRTEQLGRFEAIGFPPWPAELMSPPQVAPLPTEELLY